MNGIHVEPGSALAEHLIAINSGGELDKHGNPTIPDGGLTIDPDTGLIYNVNDQDEITGLFGAVGDSGTGEDSDHSSGVLARLIELDGGLADEGGSFASHNSPSRFLDPTTGLIVDGEGQPVKDTSVFMTHEDYERQRLSAHLLSLIHI